MSEEKLKIAFFGSPDFSADFLERLILQEPSPVEICLVITQPDKPAGRGLSLTKTPVKQIAHKYSLPVYDTPLRGSSHNLSTLLHTLHIDLGLVFAFNEIIPQHMLSIPQLGFWNIHPSLLPKYRGPSPIAFPLALHEKITGVSLMQMSERMDAGHIIKQRRVSITIDDTYLSLLKRLTDEGFSLLKEALYTLQEQSNVSSYMQNDANATYTYKLNRQDGYLELAHLKALLKGQAVPVSAISLYTKYREKNPSEKADGFFSLLEFFDVWRALHPWPGVWTQVPTKEGDKRLKILDVALERGAPRIRMVQLEGKKAVPFEVFQAGYPYIFS